MQRKQVVTAQNTHESPETGIIKSGIVAEVKVKRRKRKADILDLTDMEFAVLLKAILESFEFDGHAISKTLIDRSLHTYFASVLKDPASTPFIRISAIMIFEEMGKCFIKDEEQWEKCIKHFNFTKEVVQKDKQG